jgi:hypothetical protein
LFREVQIGFRWLLHLAGVILAVALGVGLWKQWTLICNEACAPGRALMVILLSFLLPAGAYLTLLVWTAVRPRPVARVISAALTLASLMAAMWLSFFE